MRVTSAAAKDCLLQAVNPGLPSQFVARDGNRTWVGVSFLISEVQMRGGTIKHLINNGLRGVRVRECLRDIKRFHGNWLFQQLLKDVLRMKLPFLYFTEYAIFNTC
jgi:hypothetical protein